MLVPIRMAPITLASTLVAVYLRYHLTRSFSPSEEMPRILSTNRLALVKVKCSAI